jgi:glycosyltransferase involved in cell wall biosynthesis
VLHEQSGLIVPPDNASALANSITRLLEHPDLARSMGQAGRRHVQENFSLERTASAYEGIYQRLVNNYEH